MKDKFSMRDKGLSAKRISIISLAAMVLLFAVVAGIARTNMDQQGGRDEARVELSANGFTPDQIQHSPGTFAIAVENKSPSEEHTLRLKADDGTVLNEFAIQKGSSAWTVNLPTGRYVLTEVSNPQWICRIVVR